MRRFATTAAVLLVASAAGCGAREGGPTEPEGEDNDWPSHLITGEGTGPALYLTPEADSPAIGYVSPGIVVRLAGPPRGDRIPVWIDGPLKVRGYLTMQRVAGLVQKRGRVPDTPTYLGPNDVVGIRGSAGEGLLQVEVTPWLGRPDAPALPSFTGPYPVDRIAHEEVDPTTVEGPSEGEPHTLPAGEEVPVYESPNGEVLLTLPALDPPLTVVVLRERGEWKGVRAGVGPYVVGYVDADLEPTDEAPSGGEGIIGRAARGGPIPERLASDQERPLWRLPERTRIDFDGTTVAQLLEPGLAREMNRYETGEVDVFVAVNDDVAIRGMVDTDDLEPYEGPGQPPASGDEGSDGEGGSSEGEAQTSEGEAETSEGESGEEASEGESGEEASEDSDPVMNPPPAPDPTQTSDE